LANRIISVYRDVFGLDSAEDASDEHSAFGRWSSAFVKFRCSVCLGIFR